MESGLLSNFHDDHYDANYSKYENNLDLWSNGNDTMGLQLSETLHGIFPIAATEETSNFFETDLEHRIAYPENDDLQESISKIDQDHNEHDYLLQNFDADDGISDSMSPSIEIIAVDPNCDFTSPMTVDEYVEGDSDSNDDSTERCSSRSSQYSNGSDSSSIGDYESHSSDDEDNVNCMNNKITDDQIDIKDFDLTAYITQDHYDFLDPKTAVRSDNVKFSTNNLYSLNEIKIEPKSDSETEAIIDIETVHENDDVKPILLRNQQKVVDYNLNIDEGPNEDDTRHDPSWSPTGEKTGKLAKSRRQIKSKKASNLLTQCTRMLNSSRTTNLASNKSQVVMDRKKYGLGKGKDISMCRRPEDDEPYFESENKTKQNSAIISNKFDDKAIMKIDRVTENKFMIKLESDSTNNTAGNKIKIETDSPAIKLEPLDKTEIEQPKIQIQVSQAVVDACQEKSEPTNPEVSPMVPIKKKLNLEEYKRRRENQLTGDTKLKKCILYEPIQIPIPSAKRENSKNTASPTVPEESASAKNSIAQINLSSSSCKRDKQFSDPITEAKNKVLRLQELKKAAQTKRIDSAVSAKVGPVTPILPLEQICNNNSNSSESKQAILNREYEEIIIVSASCNTDITLPPNFGCLTANGVVTSRNGTLNKIIKSSTLLSDINNTIKKVNTTKISSNSLLSSIQDVVLKKSTTTLLNGVAVAQKSPNIGISPPSQFSPQKPEMSQTDYANTAGQATFVNAQQTNTKDVEHGEDKIIMHLRKDRIRKQTFSVSIQTDNLPQFPPLTLLLTKKRTTSQSSVKSKRRKRHYRSRRSSTRSSVEDHDDHCYSSRNHIRYRSVSSQGTNRSLSPHSSRYSSERNTRCYSNDRHRTDSPYRKTRRRSSRSCSRGEFEMDRRSRSRERRSRRYSSSHSSSSSSNSSSSSSSNSSSGSDSSSDSRSRSRTSRSPRSRTRSRYPSNSESRRHSNYRRFSPAVEERRIVYVGRIERETSKEDLKRKFSAYGPIKQITVHYKDTGMKYGFVTFERAKDAYDVIDCSMTDSKINMYDVSFGGRRAFCRATYADLDGAATNTFQDLPYSIQPAASRPITYEDDSFESLLQKVKEKLSSTKPTSSASSSSSRSVKT